MQKLEEKIQFIPLTYDYMFKKVFMEYPVILKKLLISVLKLDINPSTSELVFLNSELPKTKRKEYRKTVDILVTINKVRIIDVEINTESYHDINERNTFYLEKIISMGVEKGTTYKEMKNYYFYQLNLNVFGKDNYFKDKYFTFREEKTNELLTPNIEIIYKSLDYYYDLYYNKGEDVDEAALWLILINAKNFKELESIAKILMTEKEYNRFMKIVRDGCMDGFSLANWESDKMEYLVRTRAKEREARERKEREERKKKDREEREKIKLEKEEFKKEKIQLKDEKAQLKDEKAQLKDEKAQLKDEKAQLKDEREQYEHDKVKYKEKVEQETQENMIRKMLKNNINYEIISEVSGKTIEEIKEIEDNIS